MTFRRGRGESTIPTAVVVDLTLTMHLQNRTVSPNANFMHFRELRVSGTVVDPTRIIFLGRTGAKRSDNPHEANSINNIANQFSSKSKKVKLRVRLVPEF